MSDELSGTALVTGGGRGIGERIVRELGGAGMQVAVTGGTPDEVKAVAAAVDGLPLVGDVSERGTAEDWVRRAEDRFGPIDLLVNNAGIDSARGPLWEQDADDWWHVFEVNVLGAMLASRAVLPGMIERGRGRIVNLGSGGSYLPVRAAPGTALGTAYGPSKALGRFSELLAAQVWATGVRVFLISPGLVRTRMTEEWFGDDAVDAAELAPRLVRVLASGRADALAGRYIHAEHDDVEELIRRADGSSSRTMNAPPPPLTPSPLPSRPRMPFYICPNCKRPVAGQRWVRGFHAAGAAVPALRLRLPLRAARGLLPRALDRLRRLRRRRCVIAVGRGVFELTGFGERDLLGRPLVEALSLSDTAPLELVREWGVRRLGEQLELATRAGFRKPVTADFFPAYDADGGLLVGLTPR